MSEQANEVRARWARAGLKSIAHPRAPSPPDFRLRNRAREIDFMQRAENLHKITHP